MPADHVLADTAKWVPQRPHTANEFRSIQTTMEISGAFEGTDRPRGYRARGARIAVGAIRARCCRQVRRRGDQGAPFELRMRGIGRDVRLGRLGAGIVIMARFAAVAALVVFVLVRETESRMTHLVQPNLRCLRVARKDCHSTARATVLG